MSKKRLLGFWIVCAIAATAMGQVTLISDDFSTDTSGDYTIINGGVGPGDGSVMFGFDYGDLDDPIPSAPSTTDGSTSGVRISVNDTAPAQEEGYTLFHNTEIVGVTDYTMTVDVYLGIWANTADTGTTEHAHIGVGGDGETLNMAFQASDGVLQGSGNYIFFSGDGGDSSDYRHWRDNANGGANPAPVNQFDADYLSTDGGTNVTGDNFPFFEAIANFNAPFPGNPGNQWATVRVEVLQSEGVIKYFIRGGSDETTGDPFNPAPAEFIQIIEAPLTDPEGFVSIGLADLYSSVAVDPENQFAIFDNLVVTGSGEITGGGGGGDDVDGDFDDNGALEGADIDALVTEIAAATNSPAFDLDGDGAVTTADRDAWLVEAGGLLLGDQNLDGSVNSTDLGLLLNNFGGNSTYTGGDLNGDVDVNSTDLGLLLNNFGSTAASASAVPEPSSMPLALMALCFVLGFRRRTS